MKLRILEILKEKGKTKYWLNMQLGMSFSTLQALCEILECTPNDLFEEFHNK